MTNTIDLLKDRRHEFSVEQQMPGMPINKPHRAEESRMLKELSWYILDNSKQMENKNKK